MNLNFNDQGLIPAIIQDVNTHEVLMLGYMNQEAFRITIETKEVTFFSRSRKRIWTKGEESGNVLELVSIKNDCDNDTLLIQVIPVGPTCHKGTNTCWGQQKYVDFGQIERLESVINNRKINPSENSYVSSLFKDGMNKIAQKVGEEAVEVVIEAMDNNDTLFIDESADLLFHYLVLLNAKGFQLKDVLEVMKQREH